MTEKNTSATSTSTPTERRSGERVPIQVPVKVRQQGSEHQGVTSDLSSSGIFLYSESEMKAGSKLELVIMLPGGVGLVGGWRGGLSGGGLGERGRGGPPSACRPRLGECQVLSCLPSRPASH